MSEWSNILPLISRSLTALRACPDGLVALRAATDRLLSVTTECLNHTTTWVQFSAGVTEMSDPQVSVTQWHDTASMSLKHKYVS